MRPIRNTLFVLYLLFFSSASFGQQTYPSTFLWKISGKDLNQPSYLYGTMHVQDRRLFYFGDSLYAAIEKTEGFSIEINPDEMMDSIFKSIGKEDTSALLRKILSETEYKKIEKKLEKKFKTSADKITTKKLAEEKKRMRGMFRKKDDMPTIMDLYLFSIARKQGKLTGGIEDLADQFEIADEIGKFDVNDIFKDDSTQVSSYMENMLKIYAGKDLTTLNRIVNGISADDYKDLLLIKRNRKMAMRMDSLSHVRTTFFAVGAAHLPGDSGVITLLTKMGYKVEPVFSSKDLAPEDYTYTVKEQVWLKVEDENKMCAVYMPGNPTDVMAQATLPMKMYMDMSDLHVYGIAVTPLSEEDAKSDTIFDRLISNYKKADLEIKSIKKMSYKNNPAIEMYAIQEGAGDYRYRMIIKGNKLFLVIYGGKPNDNLFDGNAEKFMNSLVFNEENIAGTNKWQQFENAKNAFSVLVPGKTVESRPKNEEGEFYDQYTSVDYNDGTYYMVVVRDTKPGYYIEDDSLYFNEYRKNLESIPTYTVKEFDLVKFKDHNACHFVALQKEKNSEILLEGYLIRRGGRTYVPMAIMPKEKAGFPAITNFFRSFTPIPYKTSGWKNRTLPETVVSTYVPAPFERVVQDSTSYDFNPYLKKYHTVDVNTAQSFSVEIETLSPYYWSKSDSSFFKNRVDAFNTRGDSLISWNYKDAVVKEAAALIRTENTEVFKKLRFFLNGDTLYTFWAYQNSERLNSENAQKYFSDIKFSAQHPTTVFVSKAALLLAALKSGDSLTVDKSRDVLKVVDFSKKDLPLLFDALSRKYKSYQNEYRSTNELIATQIAELNDNSIVDLVRARYDVKNDSTEDVQMLMLELLAKQKTSVSFGLLKQLLLNHPPKKGNIYPVINALTDTLNLAKDIFPDITALYADTVTGAGMVKLAVELLDSSIVSPVTVLQNENGLIGLAQKQFAAFKKDKDTYQVYNAEVIDLLGRFKTDQGNDMLYKFLSLPDMWVKNNAALALLKNNKTVPEAEIRKFVTDKAWRAAFYGSLKSINKTALFPTAFYSQQKFAESYLYSSLTDSYEVDVKSMQFIKEKSAEVNGKLQRFYIYKVILNDDEDKTARVAICGAFNMNKDIAEISEEEQDVHFDYDDIFSLSTLDEVFTKYIEEKSKGIKND